MEATRGKTGAGRGQGASAPGEATAAGRPRSAGAAKSRRPRISQQMRILLFVAGWLLVAIGIAGLVLPGIQGVVTIALGVAVLSVVSRTVHGWTRRVLGRWPGLLRRVERLRYKVRQRFASKRRGPG